MRLKNPIHKIRKIKILMLIKHPVDGVRSFLVIPYLLFAFIAGWSQPDSAYTFDEKFAIASVNGFPVSLAEFDLHLNESRTHVVSKYIREYNLDEISSDFWHTKFEGTKPLDLLKEVALRKAIETKISLLYMYEKGVIKSPDYSYFLQLYEEFCRARRTSGTGNIVYGPNTMSERDFFHFWYANSLIELKRRFLYEEQSCIPYASTEKTRSPNRTASSVLIRNSKKWKTDRETDLIYQQRIQEYQSVAEIKIDYPSLQQINLIF